MPGVEAETANVNGRIFALYNPGFYDDETHYQDVVETAPGGLMVGDTFTVEDNSALLDTEAQIDPENDSIDLVTTRQGFGALEGLSHNQRAVGNAIERVFDAGLDPESQFGQNVANLFVLADGEYQDFLKQLTGAEFANYLQSVLWSTRTIKRTITERMECDAGYAAGAVANVNGLQVKPTADLAPEASDASRLERAISGAAAVAPGTTSMATIMRLAMTRRRCRSPSVPTTPSPTASMPVSRAAGSARR